MSRKINETWVAHIENARIHFQLMVDGDCDGAFTFTCYRGGDVIFTVWVSMNRRWAVIGQEWVGYFGEIFDHPGHAVIFKETCRLDLRKERAE